MVARPLAGWHSPRSGSLNSVLTTLTVLCLLTLSTGSPNKLSHSGSSVDSRAAHGRELKLTKWRLCPATSGSEGSPSNADCFDAQVPSTVLSSMLRNGTFFPGIEDPYFEENISKISDISDVGSAFYTRWWRTVVPTEALQALRGDDSCSSIDSVDESDGGLRFVLTLHGVNYRAQVWVDGHRLTPLKDVEEAGMFHRFSYDITESATKVLLAGPPSGGEDARVPGVGVSVLVQPPDYPGVPNVGQGGNHDIAKNAAEMQCTAGWDWIQGTPDRNTGLWDKVTVEAARSVRLTDPAVATKELSCAGSDGSSECEGSTTPTAVLTPKVLVHNLQNRQIEAVVAFTMGHHVHSEQPVASTSLRVTLQPQEARDLLLPDVAVSDAHLWWPHTHGAQYMYPSTFSVHTCDSPSQCRNLELSLRPSGNSAAPAGEDLGCPLGSVNIDFGIRLTESYVDPTTGGPAFKVNGVRIFLQGGNWIATDQMLRFTDDRQRYQDEVSMHADMGLNIIRVWGGGVTERPLFYEACDRLGVLVMQEFWMTGDNNGRWAGNYSWPLDHDAYLAAVDDVVLMLRKHTSLLFWCGGNELYPESVSPFPDIQAGISSIVANRDAGRFYIPSSMSNYTDYDPKYGLAPQDGPYGIMQPWQFFEKNPGLSFWNGTRCTFDISFQPEIGSVSTPTLPSLKRFMSEETLNAFPTNNSQVNSVWNYHKYIPYTDSYHVDHIAAYGVPHSIEEYAFQSQLAQLTQYQSMYEGFQEHMWTFYAAMIMWKSQSPWPTLRGALYDSYMAQTGGYYGVRRAVASSVHVQLNRKYHTVAVVDKGRRCTDGHSNNNEAMSYIVRVHYYAVSGSHVGSEEMAIEDVGCQQVKSSSHPITIPRDCGEVCLAKMTLSPAGSDGVETSVVDANTYWIPEKEGDFTALSLFRMTAKHSTLDVAARVASVDHEYVSIDVHVLNSGSVTSWFVQFSLESEDGFTPHHSLCRTGTVAETETESDAKPFDSSSDQRILPSFYSDNYLVMVPKESSTIRIQCRRSNSEDTEAFRSHRSGMVIRVSSFNGAEQTVPVVSGNLNSSEY